MSSSIFNGVKDGVLFAIFARSITGDYMSKLDLSSQVLQNSWRYTGEPICVTSFSVIPYADLPCGVEKIQHRWIFFL